MTLNELMQCVFLIALFSIVILGAAGIYSWIVTAFNIDDLHDLDLEDDEF